MVGGGIVGLSTAMSLCERLPGPDVVVLEKEPDWARHQTGRNSGVIHSGVYYRPGSLKAKLARTGAAAMVDFCRRNGLAHEVCGKLIVATEQEELPRLEELARRARENGVAAELVGRDGIRALEPHASGIAALHVPEAGIADYRAVARRLAAIAAQAGAQLHVGAEVQSIAPDASGVTVGTTVGPFRARYLVNCAGLHADRLARLAGVNPGVRIVPFRGEYFELEPASRGLVRNLIYPVPDPAFPFLGVHLTRMIDGSVHVGPNAVLALSREGYRRRDVSVRDTAAVLGYSGFRRLAAKHWREGSREVWRSLSRSAFARSAQRLVPAVGRGDLVPSPAGVRAQALHPSGALVDDFLFIRSDRCLHVANAPSPAATASLPIGSMIADELLAVRAGRAASAGAIAV